MNNQIIPAAERETRIVDYFRHDLVQENFAKVLGDRRARGFVMGVLISVAENKALQDCTLPSIYTSAMRAALLGLSVDPSTKQAYLAPFKDKCTLIVGYKGLYDMAVRTGKYRYINTTPIFEGETVVENRITGFHRIEGAPKDKKNTIGWLSAFEFFEGYGKTLYMTVAEIHEHAKRFSKSYNNRDSAWKTNPEEMESKTVLRRLLTKWGYLDPADKQLLDTGDEIVGAPELPTPEPSANGGSDAPRRSAEEIKAELGFETRVEDLEAPNQENDADTFLASASKLMSAQEAGGILDRFKGNAKQAWEYVGSISQPAP